MIFMDKNRAPGVKTFRLGKIGFLLDVFAVRPVMTPPAETPPPVCFVERAVLPEWAARQRTRLPVIALLTRVLRPGSYSGYGSYRRRLPVMQMIADKMSVDPPLSNNSAWNHQSSAAPLTMQKVIAPGVQFDALACGNIHPT